MAFAFTKISDSVSGDMRITGGTFTNGGADTGGEIYTGLSRVAGLFLQQGGSSVVAEQPVVYETFPLSGSVTIVTTAGADGWWFAFGT